MSERGSTVAAIVLAAGRSSRMGELKPLMPFGGSTVLGHVVGVLNAAGVSDVRVVTGHAGDRVGAEARRAGAVDVDNPEHVEGMLSSVRSGIRSLSPHIGAALLLPADMPFVRPATIARIAGAAGAAPLVHPTFRGRRGHPPLIGRALFPAILAGEGRLSDIFRAIASGALDLPVFDRGVVTDMDGPDDHARLAAALAGHAHPDADECEALFDDAGTPEATRRHCLAVGALALSLAERLAQAGVAVDVALVAAAARLHDIAKAEPDHPAAGATRLRALGFAEVADVVARHMTLPAGEPPLSAASLVYLADKRVLGERVVTIGERFAPALVRHAASPEALAAVRRRRDTALAVEAAVEAVIGTIAEPAT